MSNPQNRIVHYVLSNGQCRPFLVTRAWNENTVNGTLFIDGSNDYGDIPYWNQTTEERGAKAVLTIWKTSIGYYDNSENTPTSNTWHWPEIE